MAGERAPRQARFAATLAVVAALWAAGTATAQVGPRAAVSGFVGVDTDNQESDVTTGGALLVDLTERFAIEGQGAYLRHGDGAHALTAGGSVMVNVVPTRNAVVPYGVAGLGFYRWSVDLDRPRFLGPTGIEFGAGALPPFYARRLGTVTSSAGAALGLRTFTDPVVSLGGGVRFHVTERLMVRPDVRTLFVFTGDDVDSVGVFVVHVAYRF